MLNHTQNSVRRRLPAWLRPDCSANADEQFLDPVTYRQVITDPVSLAKIGYNVIPLDANGMSLVNVFRDATSCPVAVRRLFSRYDWSGIGIVVFGRSGADVWSLIDIQRLRSIPCWWGLDARIAATLDGLAAAGAINNLFPWLH